MKDFDTVAIFPGNGKYEQAASRQEELYRRDNDLRSEFYRDYTRILFSQGFRRLKHKTQVFFAVDNDHVCTRSEHVSLVESISYTIASKLGLNSELARAIAIGHDLGHAPYGHRGEKILNEMAANHGLDKFFHEKNSLRYIDMIETLEDNDYNRWNLNLTYAIRDGIICHCGEMNQKHIKPRDEIIDLDDYAYPGQYQPYTYEGCVVKMADKISYLARDIEDAIRLGILSKDTLDEFRREINEFTGVSTFEAINNGTVVNYFIVDVVKNSTVAEGISLSKQGYELMKMFMKFNYTKIYLDPRLDVYNRHVENILDSIFLLLERFYKEAIAAKTDFPEILEKYNRNYPTLINSFSSFVLKYSNFRTKPYYKNKIIYDFNADSQAIYRCLIDYLAGMSDTFLKKVYEEVLSYN